MTSPKIVNGSVVTLLITLHKHYLTIVSNFLATPFDGSETNLALYKPNAFLNMFAHCKMAYLFVTVQRIKMGKSK